MPTLQTIRLTPLSPVLKKPNATVYPAFKGVAIMRLSRTEFWVHDVKHQVGVVISDWYQAQEVQQKLAEDF